MSTPQTRWHAAAQLQQLIQEGKAEDVLMTYSFCKQSCDYVYGILQHVAFDDSDGGIDPLVREFARNLLDDWSK